MNKHQRRLKTIEVSLTPLEVVLLWMKNVLSKSYEEGAFQSPPPRSAIAHSIAQIVRSALTNKPDSIVERAILQARKEADFLYMVVVELNSRVQNQFFEREREYWFLCAYLLATIRDSLSSASDEEVRTVTLLFLEPILVLESVVLRISGELFDGHSTLFSDSATKLQEQMELVDKVLELFNLQATEAKRPLLKIEEIRGGLDSVIDQQILRMTLLARGGMLRMLGEESEFRANFNRLAVTYSSIRIEGQDA